MLVGGERGSEGQGRRRGDQAVRARHALYDKGDYPGALLSYKAAFELVPSPDILFNLGLAQEKTLAYADCVLSFEQYVTIGGKDVEDAKARAAGCRAHVRIPVTITSDPDGVEISLITDGGPSKLGRTPATIELAPGTFEISLDKQGFVSQQARFDVTIGKPQSYDFELTKLSKLRVAANVEGAMI